MANEEAVIQGITIPKGMVVNLCVYGMHYDPEYWPDPDRFDPERWVQVMDLFVSSLHTISISSGLDFIM